MKLYRLTKSRALNSNFWVSKTDSRGIKKEIFGFRNQNSRAEIENPERLSLITTSKKYAPRVLENFTVDYPATRKMSRSKIDIN